ncbi:MAG: hypothetical protein HYV63_32730 [Candidatus Schekmanbacteria bacterium]|nr:hypothetical protein [Candidatus Schekmanbacteria bacterium]
MVTTDILATPANALFPRLFTRAREGLATPSGGFAFCILAALIGAAATSSPPDRDQFFGDESTYYMMAWSLACDGDLTYERADLQRVYEHGYAGGPNGVFLKRHPDGPKGGDHAARILFSKSFAYPVFAAPWVKVFGDRGFLIFHAVLLALMAGTGARYLAAASSAGGALLAGTFFFASAFPVYFFWRTPEIFNGALLFFGGVLWLTGRPHSREAPVTRGQLALLCASAVLFGLATYAKPSHLALAGAMLADLLFSRRLRLLFVVAPLFLATAGGLFFAEAALNGSWNFMGGDRKTFVFRFPLETPESRFDNLGISMITDTETLEVPFSLSLLTRNLRDFFVGRYTGALVYMLPGFLLWAWAAGAALRRQGMDQPRLLLLLATSALMLTYLVLVPENWLGGGGALGNRYMTNAYPILLLLLPRRAGEAIGAAVNAESESRVVPSGKTLRRLILVSWIGGGVFLGGIWAHPIKSSLEPDAHIDAAPFGWLPLELSLLTNLPFNIHKSKHRVPFGDPPAMYLYFPDHGSHPLEPSRAGYWTAGAVTSRAVLRVVNDVGGLRVSVGSSPVRNRVTVRFAGERYAVDLEAGQQRSFDFALSGGFPWRGTHLYELEVVSSSSFVPRFSLPGSADPRNLGIFVRLDLLPSGTGGEQ